MNIEHDNLRMRASTASFPGKNASEIIEALAALKPDAGLERYKPEDVDILFWEFEWDVAYDDKEDCWRITECPERHYKADDMLKAIAPFMNDGYIEVEVVVTGVIYLLEMGV